MIILFNKSFIIQTLQYKICIIKIVSSSISGYNDEFETTGGCETARNWNEVGNKQVLPPVSPAPSMMDLSSPSPKMGKFFSKNKKNGGVKGSGKL